MKNKMLKPIKELFDKLNLYDLEEVQFDGKVSVYIIKKIREDYFECTRISSWADVKINYMRVSYVTVLDRYNEVHE